MMKQASKIDVAVLILFFNRPEHLKKCLKKCAKRVLRDYSSIKTDQGQKRIWTE